jgi:hypothetical protein
MINKPFKVEISHWDEVVSIVKDHSDITAQEAVELCFRALVAVGYHPDNIREFIEVDL